MWEQRNFPGTGVRFCFWHMFVFEMCFSNFLCCLPVVSYKSLLCYLSWKMVASLLKKTLGLKALSPCQYCPLWLCCNLYMFTCHKWSARHHSFAPYSQVIAAGCSNFHLPHGKISGIGRSADIAGIRVWALWNFTEFQLIYRFWILSCILYSFSFVLFTTQQCKLQRVRVEDKRVRILQVTAPMWGLSWCVGYYDCSEESLEGRDTREARWHLTDQLPGDVWTAQRIFVVVLVLVVFCFQIGLKNNPGWPGIHRSHLLLPL